MKKGVLLLNLGTPKSPSIQDVYSYLIEFLTDKRVIDYPYFLRQLLVRGIIVPFRVKHSASAYQQIWCSDGSPLLSYGMHVSQQLQKKLGEDFQVELAMRYQNPSIASALDKLYGVNKLLIFPLFPQYASATTGSIFEQVMHLMQGNMMFPHLHFMRDFYAHPSYLDAMTKKGLEYDLEAYDRILFSFHGLPDRQIKKGDPSHHCLKAKNCCAKVGENNAGCYSAQCFATAREITRRLKIPPWKYRVTFQSRLGRDKWLQPYTQDTLIHLAKEGIKKILVFCPSFVADCLETLYEIEVENQIEFLKHGGLKLQLVSALNAESYWIDALKDMIMGEFHEISTYDVTRQRPRYFDQVLYRNHADEAPSEERLPSW